MIHANEQDSKKPVWLSWSTGKDSAYTLYQLQRSDEWQIEALVTTLTSSFDRVAMHSTRRALLERQAKSLGLSLEIVEIPQNCPNELYESAFLKTLDKAEQSQVTAMAFGDLFLKDIRRYREGLFQNSGLHPIFPIWETPTHELAQTIIRLGFEAYLTCVDPKKLPPSFAGRRYDESLLADLPASVDPCGENGEFHTFVFNGPNFDFPIACTTGEVVERDGFAFADIVATH